VHATTLVPAAELQAREESRTSSIATKVIAAIALFIVVILLYFFLSMR
jgi:hypothetical protein